MSKHILNGPNFSGRTRRLREWIGLPNDPRIEPACNNTAYIGPDPAGSLSGIAPTVDAELTLLAADKTSAVKSKNAIHELGFGYCLGQNPFTLSGGEQVITAIIAATGSRPDRIAIDCALEQLSSDTRINIISYLDSLDIEVMIADNRLDEWSLKSTEYLQSANDAPTIRPSIALHIEQSPCTIELINLCHSYEKGRMVFKNLNFRFEPGAAYQLKGPNGSGKTTLSKILCGLIKPTSGEIRINGKLVEPWRKPGTFASYHFQHPDLQLFSTTVRKQLSQSDNVDDFASWFGLDKYIDHHPLDLPFVLKKRVALATAMKKRADFLILDEPTLSQDNFSSQNIKNLGSLNVSGFVVSHSQMFMNLPAIHLPG